MSKLQIVFIQERIADRLVQLNTANLECTVSIGSATTAFQQLSVALRSSHKRLVEKNRRRALKEIARIMARFR